jgi:hypothetical protein
MSESSTFTARAGLVALGMHFQQLQVWDVVTQHVHIHQKVHQHTPLEKLLDCFINILAGGHGLVEINTRVRPDQAVQVAFGRTGCAEQSTVSEALNACTADNVQQLRVAIETILRQYGHCYRHDYQAHWQLLDVDMTGLPAGRLGEGVTKGYFAHRQNARGRQLGRVVATHYDEVIVDRLYEGKRQLEASLPELVTLTENALQLTEDQRKRTILRMDGGGGSDTDINDLLQRDYHILVKIHNWQRAVKLATSVLHWYPDTKVSDREVGWVEKPHTYARPTRQVAVRKRKPDGTWRYQVLVCTLPEEVLFELAHLKMPSTPTNSEILFAILYAYDGRRGGAETQNKNDKQGLGLSHRNKRRSAAQEMLVVLAQLAHNLVIWTRNDLAQVDPRLEKFGVLRTVRDVFQIPGCIQISATGRVTHVTLNVHHPLAASALRVSDLWFKADDLLVNLGKI